MFSKRIGMLLTGLMGLLVLLFFVSTFQKPQPPVRGVMENMGGADMTFSNVSFVQMRNGLKDLELTAREARWFDKSQTTFLKDILVIMPERAGGVIQLHGTHGTIDAEGRTIEIQGGEEPVSVEWSQGYRLRTASLTWSSEEGRVYTRDPVLFAGQGMVIYGTGMQLSSDHSEVNIQNVHAEIY